MPFHAYMFLEHREKGSQIKGNSEKKEKTKDGKTTDTMCLVQAVNHGVRLPYNEQTGTAASEVVHRPYNITVNMDRALPEMYKSMVEKWPLNVNIYFFGSTPSDELTHNWFTTKMTDCRVVDINLRKAMVMGGADIPDLVDFSFTYYHITWQDLDDKVEAEDSWAEAGGTTAGRK